MWYLVLYCAASKSASLPRFYLFQYKIRFETDTLADDLEFRINNQRGYTWKSWVLLAPISCAALIAISRTMDYRHHATDVIAGAIIGILVAWYAYRQYYPVSMSPGAIANSAAPCCSAQLEAILSSDCAS